MIKYLPLCLFMVCLTLKIDAQNPQNKNAIKFSVLWADYVNPNGGNLSDYKNYQYGFSAAYARSLASFVNLELPVKVLNSGVKGQSSNLFMYGLDAQLHFQYYKPNQAVVPYLLVGAGLNVIDTQGLHIEFPVGLGVDLRLFDRGYLNFQGEYRFSNKVDRKSMLLGVGIKYLLGKGKSMDQDMDGVPDSIDKCPNIKGLAAFDGCPDTDGDGVPDYLDKCPTVKGSPATSGCPDTDGDGIPDLEDKCPNEKGPISNNGCPIKDRDGDGIDDILDKCPDVFGSATARGCPDRDEDGIADSEDECPDVIGLREFQGCPDTDGDGVEDRIDRCPKVPGTKANKGCPEIEVKDKQKLELAMQAVQFELGKTVLLPQSNRVLDDIADIMKKYPDYSLEISGHTDPSGKRETNTKLSTNRAKACYNYLVSKGISTGRMSYAGYGPDKPRYDNSTDQGRILNRRVEFNMYVK